MSDNFTETVPLEIFCLSNKIFWVSMVAKITHFCQSKEEAIWS